jgi:hypothetical protein
MGRNQVTELLITYRVNGDASSFVGREAVSVYQLAVLITAFNILESGMQPTRGFGRKQALAMATSYTKVPYKWKDREKAKKDLKAHMELLKSTIPTAIAN